MRRLVALVALCLVAATISSAQAQQALPTPSVVVVDMTQIMHDAKAAKDIQAQIEKEMNAYSSEVSSQENDLKSLRDNLERQRTVLATDAFNMKSQEYQQRYAALDRDVQLKRQEMQQSYSEAMTKVETAALQIIADVAKERKANMVLAKAALLYMDNAFDVTPEVTRRLDEKFPSMAVNLHRPGTATAATAAAKAPPPAAQK